MDGQSIFDGYPREMVHPGYRVDPNSQEAYRASQTRLAPVTVFAPWQEDEYRAQGYRLKGENIVVPAAALEYPKTMTHPEHVEGVPATTQIVAIDGKIEAIPIPGTPEKYPHVVVESGAEEKEWRGKGYLPAGEWNPEAYDHATVAPGVPGGEWPKMVDGQLVQDPDAPPPPSNEYPKCVFPPGCDMSNPPIVNSREEEYKIMGMPPVMAVEIIANAGARLMEASYAVDPKARKRRTSRTKRPKRVLSEEHLAKLQAGRLAARERKAHGEEQGRACDARVQDWSAPQRLEEGSEGQEP